MKAMILRGTAIAGLALLALSANLASAQAANVQIITDTPTDLRIQWLVAPIDTGGNPLPTFDIPALVNWRILDADYVYHGGGTPSDVDIDVQHIVAPHAGDAGAGNVANLAFSFPYTLTPPAGIGGSTSASVDHPGIGHVDKYLLGWGYANFVGAGGGALAVILTGKHVPESMSALACNGALLGMLVVGSIFARRRESRTTQTEGLSC